MTALDVLLMGSLATDPGVVPVVIGAGGSGRTRALLAVREQLGPSSAQYVDLERAATTPERFLRALIAHSPFATPDGELPPPPATPRAAFDECLKFLAGARTRSGQPATFLLDEVLELRTFESFPGLRTVIADFVRTIESSGNRFVLSTRFANRAKRLLANGASRLQARVVEHLTPEAVRSLLVEDYRGVTTGADAGDLAVTVHALTEGRAVYVHAVLNALKAMSAEGACDPISALAAVLMPGTRLDAECRFAYEWRLHRARGYGALKGILAFLAEQQPLTLTEVARRMQRTPGSTKDYLTWLEDVDLVRCDRKRYSFGDPLLRVWVRLNGDPTPSGEEDVAREVHRYAMERLPLASPVPVPRPAARQERESGIIEID
jgi:hypothetical protein